MNFSYSKNFFFKSFSSGFYNNKFSFKILNSQLNSKKFCVNVLNKCYSTNLNVLNNSNALKAKILPSLMNGCGTSMISAEFINVEDGVISLLGGNSKNYFNYKSINKIKADNLILNEYLLTRDGKILNNSKCLQMVRSWDNGVM